MDALYLVLTNQLTESDVAVSILDYRIGAACAHRVLADLGWAYDASSFAQTCSDPAMFDEVESYSRSSFESDGAWRGFRHALGYPVK